MSPRPVIAVTMGDPAGVGPELCLRILAAPPEETGCRPVVYACAALLQRVARICEWPFDAPVYPAESLSGGLPPGNGPLVADVGGLDADTIRPGRIQAEGGAAAFHCIRKAVDAIRAGTAQGMATAPLHKEALRRAGYAWAGHTDMLAELTGAGGICMMMSAPELNVCLATTHIALAEVPGHLTAGRVLDVIRMAGEAMRRFGRPRPRIAVCGLNPHAGEHGLFGDEEARLIEPAIARARAQGMDVSGPLPSDTAFIPECRVRYDAYVALYHDQGLIPFKMLAFEHGVNVTLGLPIVRTSADHGTAFDIAWTGRASAASLLAAIRLAARLAPAGAPEPHPETGQGRQTFYS